MKVTKSTLMRILREEIQKKLDELNIKPYPGQDRGDDVLSKGLKIRHKKSGVMYTVQNVGYDDALLTTPDGKTIQLDKETIAKEYDLD